MENNMKKFECRPFDVISAKAGAPYCCRDGREATVVKFDGRFESYPLVGYFGSKDMPTSWTESGLSATHIMESPSDLVMLPLGYIDGKPVFVGDEYLGICDTPAKAQPHHAGQSWAGCRWPAPEKVYPETRMTSPELTSAFDANLMLIVALENVANAALRHAIDAGQVITKEGHEAALHRLGESLRPVADAARAERDMAVAQAACDMCARMASALNASTNVCVTIQSADLNAIIAKVAP